ncbi:forkhead box protein R1 [Heteronotia binoei]|uniref:forkhead box protein R1 n=1 Tax=Heteronotia binoei TaxID=13085 RepID=UPI00292F52D1|nr:forkhead box protein R1 [Heteronotia binoei]
MELRLQNAAFWASLPRRLAPAPGLSGPRAPAAEAEQEEEGQPHLWRWVNPNRVCPIAGRLRPPPALHGASAASPAACRRDGPRSSPPAAAPPQVGPERAGGPRPAVRRGRGLRWRGRKAKRAAGGWPPPPLNYCLLISVALSSSPDGRLAVQEIYQFTRRHFPFFRTAPDGWKNTIRHNLCFSSSFQKTADFACLEGNRRSRLWKLTPQGRCKLREEAQALSHAQRALLQQSMDGDPGLLRSLFGLLMPSSARTSREVSAARRS